MELCDEIESFIQEASLAPLSQAGSISTETGNGRTTAKDAGNAHSDVSPPLSTSDSQDLQSQRQPDSATAVQITRAKTVAKIINELNVLMPQMFEDASEYDKLHVQHPDFLAFEIAKERPDLKRKILAINGFTRHIRLAQNLPPPTT